MEYRSFHIGDTVIENENSGMKGLDVTVKVDSLEKITIYLGPSMTIRTDESGIDELRELLYKASRQVAIMGIATREG